VSEHHEEQEQIDALKRWWHENGTFVTVGVFIGVAAIAGWRTWQSWEQRAAEDASAVYSALARAVESHDAATYEALADGLVRDHARTPYAANGALLAAKAAVDAGDLAKAELRLAWVVTNGRDAELVALARVRLARVQLALDQAERALATVGVTPAGAFGPLTDEARGDALTALGRHDEARVAYRAALAGAADNQVDRGTLELKLGDLGPASVAAPAAPATGAKP